MSQFEKHNPASDIPKPLWAVLLFSLPIFLVASLFGKKIYEVSMLFYFMAMGLGCLYVGIRKIKTKRTTENIPTSKIATCAVGTNVEIKGQLDCDWEHTFKAPITRKQCGFYWVKVYATGNNAYQVGSFYATPGFYVKDSSGGHALVYPKGAQLSTVDGGRFVNSSYPDFNRLPPSLAKEVREVLHKNWSCSGLSNSQIFKSLDKTKYRFEEFCFKRGDPIYILGYAQSGIHLDASKLPVPLPNLDNSKPSFKLFSKAKKMIREDPDLHERFDKNRDGVLSREEMEKGAVELAGELQKSKASRIKSGATGHTLRLVFKGEPGHELIVTNCSEKSVAFDQMARAWGIVAFGTIVFLGGFLALFQELGR